VGKRLNYFGQKKIRAIFIVTLMTLICVTPVLLDLYSVFNSAWLIVLSILIVIMLVLLGIRWYDKDDNLE